MNIFAATRAASIPASSPITAHFDGFLGTHDGWLGMRVVDGILLGGWAFLAGGIGPRRALGWGSFGGAAPRDPRSCP